VKVHWNTSTGKSCTVVLIGDESKLEPLLADYKIPSDKIKIVHAEQVIDMHEHPTKALKEKQKSSIAIGFQLLAAGNIDAFISAGNTGAMLVGALFSIKALEGVYASNYFNYYSKRKWQHRIVT
jgi:glycerol-3-phosphate acyltransferase PlsX